jgi:membrane protein insertase Oxa1/YidC/SpoIIIJ
VPDAATSTAVEVDLASVIALQPERMQAVQAEYWQRINEIWKKHDCNPAKSLISVALQAPTFLCFFAGLRHLAAAKVCERQGRTQPHSA